MKQQQQQEQFKTMIGGQALIEGILMRGPKKQAIVVRTEEGLVEKTEELSLVKDRYPVLGLPMIRGVVNFFASMAAGVKALMYSAEFFPDDPNSEPDKLDQWLEKHFSKETVDKLVVPIGVAIGILFSVGLFFLLPETVVELCSGVITGAIARNLLAGLIRIILFIGYLFLISRMKDMRRVFSYHGAEHKTIRCYEAKLPLTVENVRMMSRFHPRCGTSFLFVVMIVSILVFSLFQQLLQLDSPVLRVIVKLLLLPLVVSISYEFNRLVGKYDNTLTKILTAPGLFFQNFTTFEPDDSMIEVGIRSLELVLPEREGEDQW